MYPLLFLFLLARRSQQVLCLGLERGLKPLSNGCLGIIIKINLTTNYQLLLNCNKVHRAEYTTIFTQNNRLKTIAKREGMTNHGLKFRFKGGGLKLMVRLGGGCTIPGR
jgi:hypothetical protein